MYVKILCELLLKNFHRKQIKMIEATKSEVPQGEVWKLNGLEEGKELEILIPSSKHVHR